MCMVRILAYLKSKSNLQCTYIMKVPLLNYLIMCEVQDSTCNQKYGKLVKLVIITCEYYSSSALFSVLGFVVLLKL